MGALGVSNELRHDGKIALDVHNNESDKMKEIVLRANGHRLTFEGYLAAYNVVSARRGKDDDPEDARVNKGDDDEKGLNDEDDDDDEDGKTSSSSSSSSRGNESWLPKLNQGDSIYVAECSPSRHETRRHRDFQKEPSLKLWKNGDIGRPSTYASVLRALVARGYVVKNGAQLVPDSKGFSSQRF